MARMVPGAEGEQRGGEMVVSYGVSGEFWGGWGKQNLTLGIRKGVLNLFCIWGLVTPVSCPTRPCSVPQPPAFKSLLPPWSSRGHIESTGETIFSPFRSGTPSTHGG